MLEIPPRNRRLDFPLSAFKYNHWVCLACIHIYCVNCWWILSYSFTKRDNQIIWRSQQKIAAKSWIHQLAINNGSVLLKTLVSASTIYVHLTNIPLRGIKRSFSAIEGLLSPMKGWLSSFEGLFSTFEDMQLPMNYVACSAYYAASSIRSRGNDLHDSPYCGELNCLLNRIKTKK